MNRDEQILDYNYADFDGNSLPKLMQRFSNQAPLGTKAPDFPMWRLTDDVDNPLEDPTTLMEVIKQHRLTVVEFGSFT